MSYNTEAEMQTQRPRKIKICFIVDKTRVGRDVHYNNIAGFYIDGKAVPPCRAGFEDSPCTTTYIRKVFNYYYISIPMYVID